MPKKFKLPEAENFSKYLEDKVDGDLTMEKSESSKPDEEDYIVKLDGIQIGIYTQGKNILSFGGRIQGYKNPALGTDEVALMTWKVKRKEYNRQDLHKTIPFP